MWVLGLMSGTSADGVDGVLAEFQGSPSRPRWRVAQSSSIPYPDDLRTQLIRYGQGHPLPAAAVLDLVEHLTEVQAQAARACDCLLYTSPSPRDRG